METAFSGASNLAEAVDRAFIFIFSIAFIFTIGITALMIYIVIHFSRKKGKVPMQFTGNTKLEILWTVIPPCDGYSGTMRFDFKYRGNRSKYSVEFDYDTINNRNIDYLNIFRYLEKLKKHSQ